MLIAVPLTMTALLASACSSKGSVSDGTASPIASTAASQVAQNPSNSFLSGGAWQLTSHASTDGSATKATSSPPAGTLVFAADGKLSGSTGCNSFNGTYMQSGSALTVTVGPLTLMACSGAAAAQETAVLASLAKVDSFTSGSKLQLKSGGDSVLTYEADVTGLAGSSWVATGINNDMGGVVSDANATKVTAKFNTEGGISGSGGCNTYGADFTTSGKNGLKISPVVSTMMACEPTSVMTTEQQYFAALARVTKYQRDGNRLTLKDENGATQVTYIPAS